MVGLEHRWLPAIQTACGDAGFAAVPAWRLPPGIERLDTTEAGLKSRLQEKFGCRPSEVIELGGAYLATPGATPELVYPWVAIVDPAHGQGRLHWISLRDCLHANLIDAHLAIAVHRAVHALTITAEP